jgi:uncharacterized protein
MNNDFFELGADDICHSILNLEQLVFEVTDACNLHCKYCGYGELYEGYDDRENKNLPFRKAKLIIDYLHGIWAEEYCDGMSSPLTIGFYGGEPLLNIALIKEVIGYLESLPFVGKTYFFGMTTNGMLIDRYVDYLVEKRFQLMISLDGNRENHSYRVDHSGKNSFDKVLTNIELLRSEYPEYYDRYVRFNSVLHNRNSVESVYDFINGYLGKSPYINGLSSDGIRRDKWEEFNKTYRNPQTSFNEAVNDSVEKLYMSNPKGKNLAEYIYYNSGNVFMNYSALLCKVNIGRHKTGTCVPLTKKMYITVNGKILQCEKISHDYALGYITDDVVVLDCSAVADRQNKYSQQLLHLCPKCALFKRCSQCIYFIDNLSGDSPICPKFSTIERSDARLQKAIDFLDENPELYKKILRDSILRS